MIGFPVLLGRPENLDLLVVPFVIDLAPSETSNVDAFDNLLDFGFDLFEDVGVPLGPSITANQDFVVLRIVGAEVDQDVLEDTIAVDVDDRDGL